MTPEEIDIRFLVRRCEKAGSCSFSEVRDTGLSSNSIVSIAYGCLALRDQCLPADMDDLNACRRMWEKLPHHRKTPDALEAMRRAEEAVR